MSSEPKAKFPIRLDPDFHRHLKSVLALKKRTIQAVVEQCLEEVVASRGASLDRTSSPSAALGPFTALDRYGISQSEDEADHEFLIICQRAQAASPVVAAKLIEALKVLGDLNVDAVTVATAEAAAAGHELEVATGAVDDLTTQTKRGNRSSTEAAPSHGLARKQK